MLRMNRYFNGGGTHNWISASSGPPCNGLMKWGQHACASGGPGRINGAVPDGYGVENALCMPIKGGAMRCYAYDWLSTSGTLNLLNGGTVTTLDGSMTFSQSGDASLITSLTGTGTMDFAAGTSSLALTLGMVGTGAITFDFDNALLAIIDPMSGSFSASLTGTSDLRGFLSMAGEFTSSETTSLVEYGGAVYVASWGSDGYSYPSGTATYPVATMACADVLAQKFNLRTYFINGSYTLEKDHSYNEFKGWGPLAACTIILDHAYTIENCKFTSLVITGEQNTIFPPYGFSANLGTIQYENCYIYALKELAGNLIHCQYAGAVTIKGGKWISASGAVIEGDTTTFDLQSTSGTTVSMDIDSGWVQLENMVTGTLAELNCKGGEISFLPSCTGGEYYLEGVGNLFDESNGGVGGAMTKKDNHFVWDDDASYHAEAGSTGEQATAVKNLVEADEYHTVSTVQKKLRGTATVLLTKNWTGTPLTNFEAVQ